MENEVLEFDIGLGSGADDDDDDDAVDIDIDDDLPSTPPHHLTTSHNSASTSATRIYLPEGDSASSGIRANYTSGNHLGISGQPLSEEDMDKKIQELRDELEYANRKCEVYRANLLSVLKDIEDHKLQLSIKVQSIKISMKGSI
ncbi:hypothetical protein H0E87_007895 [Populus deltoides]|uniref:Uncharacterized protein n=1 Tax=Populus deltoides TaxID=3696 RepID=A0A8T2YYC0_POPDE|nr:hypothetical protein H0E87_007895 [Populus deltoides]